MAMQFGVSLCPEVGRYKDTIEQTLAAEELGYDSVWLPEHHLMKEYLPSPLIGLSGLATITTNVKLGTDILVLPFYNPVRLAEDIGVLDEISEGRFIAGIGLGYREVEYDAFNVPFKKRGKVMDDNLAILKKAWQEDAVNHEGHTYRIHNVPIYPRPMQTPHPPLWIGGWSKKALERAALYGDAYFPGPTAEYETVKDSVDLYHNIRRDAGLVRETEMPMFREVWVAKDKKLLEEGKKHLWGMYKENYVSWGHRNMEGKEPTYEDIAEDRFIVGNPDDVIRSIEKWEAGIGLTHLIARFHFHGISQKAVLESMKIFAEEVIPHFTRSSKSDTDVPKLVK